MRQIHLGGLSHKSDNRINSNTRSRNGAQQNSSISVSLRSVKQRKSNLFGGLPKMNTVENQYGLLPSERFQPSEEIHNSTKNSTQMHAIFFSRSSEHESIDHRSQEHLHRAGPDIDFYSMEHGQTERLEMKKVSSMQQAKKKKVVKIKTKERQAKSIELNVPSQKEISELANAEIPQLPSYEMAAEIVNRQWEERKRLLQQKLQLKPKMNLLVNDPRVVGPELAQVSTPTFRNIKVVSQPNQDYYSGSFLLKRVTPTVVVSQIQMQTKKKEQLNQSSRSSHSSQRDHRVSRSSNHKAKDRLQKARELSEEKNKLPKDSPKFQTQNNFFIAEPSLLQSSPASNNFFLADPSEIQSTPGSNNYFKQDGRDIQMSSLLIPGSENHLVPLEGQSSQRHIESNSNATHQASRASTENENLPIATIQQIPFEISSFAPRNNELETVEENHRESLATVNSNQRQSNMNTIEIRVSGTESRQKKKEKRLKRSQSQSINNMNQQPSSGETPSLPDHLMEHDSPSFCRSYGNKSQGPKNLETSFNPFNKQISLNLKKTKDDLKFILPAVNESSIMTSSKSSRKQLSSPQMKTDGFFNPFQSTQLSQEDAKTGKRSLTKTQSFGVQIIEVGQEGKDEKKENALAVRRKSLEVQTDFEIFVRIEENSISQASKGTGAPTVSQINGVLSQHQASDQKDSPIQSTQKICQFSLSLERISDKNMMMNLDLDEIIDKPETVKLDKVVLNQCEKDLLQLMEGFKSHTPKSFSQTENDHGTLGRAMQSEKDDLFNDEESFFQSQKDKLKHNMHNEDKRLMSIFEDRHQKKTMLNGKQLLSVVSVKLVKEVQAYKLDNLIPSNKPLVCNNVLSESEWLGVHQDVHLIEQMSLKDQINEKERINHNKKEKMQKEKSKKKIKEAKILVRTIDAKQLEVKMLRVTNPRRASMRSTMNRRKSENLLRGTSMPTVLILEENQDKNLALTPIFLAQVVKQEEEEEKKEKQSSQSSQANSSISSSSSSSICKIPNPIKIAVLDPTAEKLMKKETQYQVEELHTVKNYSSNEQNLGEDIQSITDLLKRKTSQQNQMRTNTLIASKKDSFSKVKENKQSAFQLSELSQSLSDELSCSLIDSQDQVSVLFSVAGFIKAGHMIEQGIKEEDKSLDFNSQDALPECVSIQNQEREFFILKIEEYQICETKQQELPMFKQTKKPEQLLNFKAAINTFLENAISNSTIYNLFTDELQYLNNQRVHFLNVSSRLSSKIQQRNIQNLFHHLQEQYELSGEVKMKTGDFNEKVRELKRRKTIIKKIDLCPAIQEIFEIYKLLPQSVYSNKNRNRSNETQKSFQDLNFNNVSKRVIQLNLSDMVMIRQKRIKESNDLIELQYQQLRIKFGDQFFRFSLGKAQLLSLKKQRMMGGMSPQKRCMIQACDSSSFLEKIQNNFIGGYIKEKFYLHELHAKRMRESIPERDNIKLIYHYEPDQQALLVKRMQKTVKPSWDLPINFISKIIFQNELSSLKQCQFDVYKNQSLLLIKKEVKLGQTLQRDQDFNIYDEVIKRLLKQEPRLGIHINRAQEVYDLQQVEELLNFSSNLLNTLKEKVQKSVDIQNFIQSDNILRIQHPGNIDSDLPSLSNQFCYRERLKQRGFYTMLDVSFSQSRELKGKMSRRMSRAIQRTQTGENAQIMMLAIADRFLQLLNQNPNFQNHKFKCQNKNSSTGSKNMQNYLYKQDENGGTISIPRKLHRLPMVLEKFINHTNRLPRSFFQRQLLIHKGLLRKNAMMRELSPKFTELSSGIYQKLNIQDKTRFEDIIEEEHSQLEFQILANIDNITGQTPQSNLFITKNQSSSTNLKKNHKISMETIGSLMKINDFYEITSDCKTEMRPKAFMEKGLNKNEVLLNEMMVKMKDQQIDYLIKEVKYCNKSENELEFKKEIKRHNSFKDVIMDFEHQAEKCGEKVPKSPSHLWSKKTKKEKPYVSKSEQDSFFLTSELDSLLLQNSRFNESISVSSITSSQDLDSMPTISNSPTKSFGSKKQSPVNKLQIMKANKMISSFKLENEVGNQNLSKQSLSSMIHLKILEICNNTNSPRTEEQGMILRSNTSIKIERNTKYFSGLKRASFAIPPSPGAKKRKDSELNILKKKQKNKVKLNIHLKDILTNEKPIQKQMSQAARAYPTAGKKQVETQVEIGQNEKESSNESDKSLQKAVQTFVRMPSHLWQRMKMAIEENRANIVEDFILHYSNYLDCQDKNGYTPLNLAVWHGRTELVCKLLGAGANANKPNNLGNSPLHVAIDLGQKKMEDILVYAGADEKQVNKNGLIPWEGLGKTFEEILM